MSKPGMYETNDAYNTTRIHRKLKMPPAIFAARHQRSIQFTASVY
jgi:hypothetical protein